MSYIDVHCHLDGTHYGNTDEMLMRAERAGVERIIAVGFDVETSELSLRFAEKFDFVYFTAGFHPTETKRYKEGDLKKIAEIARHEKCVAIGEIGLDYHYPDTDKPLQHKIFTEQLKIALDMGLPVQIHSRDCSEDMLGVVKENKENIKLGMLLHCYSHSAEIASELDKLGVYFSFGGTSTYSGSKKAKKTIALLPLNRLLTETDSPYLPPKSKYGVFPNTPESIPEILANMAQIKGVSKEEMCGHVWANAHMLFKKLK